MVFNAVASLKGEGMSWHGRACSLWFLTGFPWSAVGGNSLPSLLQEVVLALDQHALSLISRLGEAAPPGLKVFHLTGLHIHFTEVQGLLQARTEIQRHTLSLDRGRSCEHRPPLPSQGTPKQASSGLASRDCCQARRQSLGHMYTGNSSSLRAGLCKTLC